ncbi:hypothetical protein DM02DRAFT_11388 [Periconia macrospinosa]|uniref:Uncharacterized protein n=1 Tax=Periconia macrospinosa TaxID=97972 RepID=A0A2V1EEA8_9PLEO|nr:hypothetical protein DM02DRAFT_11388 [Periconia macrospinosa]
MLSLFSSVQLLLFSEIVGLAIHVHAMYADSSRDHFSFTNQSIAPLKIIIFLAAIRTKHMLSCYDFASALTKDTESCKLRMYDLRAEKIKQGIEQSKGHSLYKFEHCFSPYPGNFVQKLTKPIQTLHNTPSR